MLLKLWNDESGAILSAEIVLVATILVIGVIVGLKSVRDAVVTELADVGAAIGSINQDFSYSGVAGHAAATAGSSFADAQDFCDGAAVSDAANSRCVTVGTVPAAAE